MLDLTLRIEVFEFFCNSIEECRSQCSINDTMVIRHGDVHHMTDRNRITLLCFDHHRSFLDSTNCQDSYLRLVDDRSSHQATECAYIGEGESTTLRIVGFQF